MSSDLTGILVALPTQFTEDGSQIDVAALHSHVDWLIESGVHGLVPGGSTGEFTALSIAERKQLTEEVVRAADGRVPVIAGTGALSTAESVELSVHAAEAGAAALMVVPPFYDAPDLDQVRRHLTAIHEASGLDIVYYNIPSASGVSLTADQIAELGSIEGVRYLKDTSGDAVSLNALLVAHQDRITAFNGYDTLTFVGLTLGAKGSVWGITNFIPELSMELWNAVAVDRDLDKGRELWAKIWPICDWAERYNYAAAIKTGMNLIGRPTGPVRAPFDLLDDEARAELTGLLKEAGVL